jgi:hypothetical protein
MEEILTITNVEKVNSNTIRIFFESNFELTNLKLQYSLNNIDWSNNIPLSGLTSPQTAVLPIPNSCYLRINNSEAVIPPPPPPPPPLIRKHSNKLTLKFS